MKQKFSKKITQYNLQKKQIQDFAAKKEYSIDNVTEYSATVGIPLYFIYYYYWTEYEIEEAKEEMLRLMEYYNLEYDL